MDESTKSDDLTDQQRFIATLEKIGIPFEAEADGKYMDVTVKASASDKYVTVCFEGGAFAFSN